MQRPEASDLLQVQHCKLMLDCIQLPLRRDFLSFAHIHIYIFLINVLVCVRVLWARVQVVASGLLAGECGYSS